MYGCTLVMLWCLTVVTGEQQRHVNLTSIVSKQAKLPCFVQAGRKFIWMQANRDEILSVDANVITGDRRFSVEMTNQCTDELNRTSTGRRRSSLAVDGDGCLVYLVINGVSLYDEGLYLCQIDTMTSTLVYLNILGEFGLAVQTYQHILKNFAKTKFHRF